MDTLKEKTAGGIMWGSIASGSQLFLGCLFGIFLARLLSPSDYGMIGVLQVFLTIASIVQDSGFRVALGNQHEIKHEDYNAVFWFNIFAASILYVCLFLLAPFITAFYQKSGIQTGYDLSELTPLMRVCALGFVSGSLGTAHNAYLFRTLKVKQKAIVTITSLTISNITGITLAALGYRYWSLAVQGIVFTSVNSILFWYLSHWRPTLPISFHPLKGMFGLSSKVMLTSIFTCINNNILSVLLGRFYSVKEVGFYNQANKWTGMGANWIQGMIMEVAQPVLRSVDKDSERQKRVFRKMLRFTSFISFPSLFGLAFIARELIMIALTDKWLPSVELMQILCICAITIPIQALCTNLIISKNRSDIVFWNTVVLGIVQIIGACAAHQYGIQIMVCIFGGINIVWLLFFYLLIRRTISLHFIEVLSDVFPFAIIASTSIVITWLLAINIENIWIRLFVKIILVAVMYTIMLRLCGTKIFSECVGFVKSKLKKSTHT